MKLDVDPRLMRIYATHLRGLQQATQKARAYVHQYGSLSVHEQGLIGKFAGYHDTYVADLNAMLDKLSTLLGSSGGALEQSASAYENTDMVSAAQVDALLPQVPRSSPSRD
ncbi:uncharacterized protein YukE [Actinoplanes octamycinicus]|uniref:Uncharacterized protein YukE n=1 Tax=Actinoplanes octamycinicus TaxID=135948 RepID=A0A7W7H5F8_9ACTN|nr:hypothetical protein [Actinoplanes octamycinicus]MBB4744365.1 uncharacterized protein YukE [Actinoplanes octamycinicus]GIE56673.1 hypothetical protein Aoc01nite_20750 [Actinoplanes octamycinicus]